MSIKRRFLPEGSARDMPGKKAAAAKKKAKKAKKATKAPKTPSVFVVPRLEDYDEAGFVESAHGRPIASLAQLWSDYPPQVWYSKGGCTCRFTWIMCCSS